jgi:rhodanese-related sulfurtransferase
LGTQQISPREAASAMRERGYVYIDVRSVEEFELGHPEGAYNVPWQQRGAAANPDFLRVVRAAFDLAQPLLVGCQTGQRSGPASTALAQAGFRDLLEQRAGYAGRRDAFGRLLEPGWQAAGLPTTTQAAPGRSYRELSERATESGA